MATHYSFCVTLLDADIDACVPQRIQVALTAIDDDGKEQLVGSCVMVVGGQQLYPIPGLPSGRAWETMLLTTDPNSFLDDDPRERVAWTDGPLQSIADFAKRL